MKILGYSYTITEDGDSNTIGALGRFHEKSQEIQIASDLCDEQKLSTIIHEVLEAINYHLGLELSHRAIIGLETALYQFLTDNGIDLSPLLEYIGK